MTLTVGYDMAPEHITVGGIKRYAAELRAALSNRSDVHLVPLGPAPRSRASTRHRIAQGVLREAWQYTVRLDRESGAAGADVLHCPSTLLPATSSRPLVATIHDVLPLAQPHLFPRVTVAQQRLLLARRARRADRLIATTRYARSGIVDLLGVREDRVRVIPCGVPARFRPAPAAPEWLRERFGIDRPFVLCVGTLEPRKNLVGALRGMRAAQLGDDVAIVIAGGQGWKNEEFEREAPRSGLPLVMTGRISDDELVRLYSSALCLVFPSLFEGFGLPPLEAMACGCPVVSTDRSALPEVVGDAGLLVDPLDPEAIGAAIRTLATDDQQREDLRGRALARAAGLGWDEIAGRTVELYRETVQERS